MVEALLESEAGQGATAEPTPRIEAVTPHLGARLSGMTLGAAMAPSDLTTLRRALADHLVLQIDDQSLSPAALRDFTAHFGPLFLHHADEGVIFADGVPEVLSMLKEPDDTRLFGGSDWHADVTFRKPAGYLSILHALEVPSFGGDTGFASTIAAFQALSPGLQSLLRGLEAIHNYDGPGRPDRAGHSAQHPVVRRHPDTGAEGLYLNRMFTTRFAGLSEDESQPLIEYLCRHMARPEFTCRLSWRAGQVVIWDNRFTLHYPINDFVGQRRHLIRCTAMEA